jgi:fumarate reductase subunit C
VGVKNARPNTRANVGWIGLFSLLLPYYNCHTDTFISQVRVSHSKTCHILGDHVRKYLRRTVNYAWHKNTDYTLFEAARQFRSIYAIDDLCIILIYAIMVPTNTHKYITISICNDFLQASACHVAIFSDVKCINLRVLHPWRWPHGLPKHVKGHCIYRLILIYLCAYVGNIIA